MVVGPRSDDLGRERLYLISDIAPFEDFLSVFAALNSDRMDTSTEMLRDALSLSQDPAQLSMVLGGGLGRSKLADKLPSRLMGLARQISQVCKQ